MSWAREQQIDEAFDVLEKHVERYERNFVSQGKQPRDKDWRPVRFAVRDVILAWVVARLQSKDNIIEVDVYLTYDPDAIPGRSGSKFATIYLLSQAYKSGSSMGIRFTENVEGGTVPIEIVDMASEYEVPLKKEHIYEGIITPKEARHLYLALTEFSPEAQKRVMELSVSDKVSPERICYMVHHLTYTKEEMESLLLGSEFPENAILGKVTPEEYLLYSDVVHRIRGVILGGALDRSLKLKEVVGEDGKVLDLEESDRQISIGFDPRYFAKVYETLEETPIPWTADRNLVVQSGERIIALIRAYDWADFEFYFQQEVETLRSLMNEYSDQSTYFFLLVPRNVLDLEELVLEKYRSDLANIGVSLMISPESISLMDQEVVRRLRECETMRHDVGSGEEREEIAILNQFDFNTTEVRLVSVPLNLRIGRLGLYDLVKQAIYDEDELSRGVNKHNVRARYHLNCDRLQFLGHQALLTGEYPTETLSQEIFPVLNQFWNVSPDKTRNMRLLPSFWVQDEFRQYIENLKSLSNQFDVKAFRQIVEFLAVAYKQNLMVIAVQNKHSTLKVSQSDQLTIATEELQSAFVGQFVPDWINDYGDLPFDEIVVKHFWRAVQSARRGQANGVNLTEVPHMIITNALHTMVYEDRKKTEGKEVSVNIVYTDGSQARPFPLFSLKQRSNEEMYELRQLHPLKIGMLSMRHPEMDSLIQQYWFRNIEISQPGMTSAEVDELCYQLTLKKLADIYHFNKPVRIAFYQTGFQAPLIGFWRAVVEFLKMGQGKSPMLEVIPYFYKKRRNVKFDRGERWH